MKPILSSMVILFAMSSIPLRAVQCAWCNQPMLEDDQYCHNCGKGKSTQPPVIRSQVPVDVAKPVVRGYDAYHSNRQYGYESDPYTGFGGHLAGMGRGLSTTSLSALNVVRGMGTGCAWIESVGLHKAGGEAVLYCSPFFISVGTVMGVFATCADVINGVFDLISVGYYGNWLYDSNESGRPTPWIWERKWYDNEIPWINRK